MMIGKSPDFWLLPDTPLAQLVVQLFCFYIKVDKTKIIAPHFLAGRIHPKILQIYLFQVVAKKFLFVLHCYDLKTIPKVRSLADNLFTLTYAYFFYRARVVRKIRLCTEITL